MAAVLTGISQYNVASTVSNFVKPLDNIQTFKDMYIQVSIFPKINVKIYSLAKINNLIPTVIFVSVLIILQVHNAQQQLVVEQIRKSFWNCNLIKAVNLVLLWKSSSVIVMLHSMITLASVPTPSLL
jgi:hypothetical protein